MVATDPVREVEHALAREIMRCSRQVCGCAETRAEVHFRDDTVVCLIESSDLPGVTPELLECGERPFAEIMERLLGRGMQRPMARSRISPTTMLAVIRLI